MAATILDGRALAAHLRADIKARVGALPAPPGLAVILVGDDPSSQIYVRAKQKACAEVGIESHVYHLPAHAHAGEVTAVIDALNDNERVNGILLQMPLPPGLNADDFLSRIDPAKDVDGLTPFNLGHLLAGRPTILPCTPQGVMRLIALTLPDISGARAVVVGRSILVGRPLAQMLLMANATVTQAHSATRDLAALTRQADILISAVGQPGLITAAHVRPGAIVIDVGITRVPSLNLPPQGGGENMTLRGDVDFDAVSKIASAITPVPGGVGPMTIACLLENTVRGAMRALSTSSF